MIKIGIDSVEIERFLPWVNFSQQKLSRIFTAEELSYSLANPLKAPERLAVRFAAKEAFYKAVTSLLAQPVPFLCLAKQCSIAYTPRGEPTIHFPWEIISLQAYHVEVTLTHTRTTATAVVLVTSNVA
jgi:holo-[acyl-carrier protein] synthase